MCNVFEKYIDDKCISNNMYAREYADQINIANNPIEFGFNRLKKGEKSP